MTSPEKDDVREERIMMEIVVDAYESEERAMGWYYYLDDELPFPFPADCTQPQPTSVLQVGEKVTVTGMPAPDVCQHDMFVNVDWQGRQLAVPPAQLTPTDEADEDAHRVAEDWHYWLARGYAF